MTSEEAEYDDYMNSAFVADLTTSTRMDQESSSLKTPRHILELERRQEGLAKPIDANNRGFAMLRKMGYKEGDSLGVKSSTGDTSDRLTVPLPIPAVPKQDRGGLGTSTTAHKRSAREMQLEAQYTRQKRMREEETKQRELGTLLRDTVYSETFAKTTRSLAKQRKIKLDLNLCRAASEDLDKRKQDECSNYVRQDFWQSTQAELKLAAALSGEQIEPDPEEEAETLLAITEHLRTKYFYCHWCGCRYDDKDELEEECPGNSAEDHE